MVGEEIKSKMERAKEVLGVEVEGGLEGVVEEARERMARAQGLQQSTVQHQQQQQQQKEEVERPRITLRGLASMQAPTKAAVLYAPPVDQFGLLQAFCEKVQDRFIQAEVMGDEGRPLLLHATVVNTVYVKGNKRAGEGKKWDRLVFDATGIIDRYEDQVWMENMPLEKVAICKMGAKKTVVNGEEDGEYEVEAEVTSYSIQRHVMMQLDIRARQLQPCLNSKLINSAS
ncbi:hypothetical protein N0V88_000549 [Collariella sp. IMI 366227]|nr:hypothetical protein N0V88_000549 [Collariella sp. IMI 366227]